VSEKSLVKNYQFYSAINFIHLIVLLTLINSALLLCYKID